MASNRMFLVEEVTGERKLLAKYYPGFGWEMERGRKTFDDWLVETERILLTRTEVNSTTGPTSFRLEFEID